tara:strand:+ start:423 stop:1562 length:1140 start_codon:yes stop_codon:yes gene_type:complete
MAYTITQLKTDLEARLHGTSLNRVQNVDGLINRAAGKILLDLDVAETKRTATIANTIHSSIYDYQLPSDLKGNKIINIYPQTGSINPISKVYSADFEVNKLTNTFAVKYDSGTKTLRYSSSGLGSGTTINTLGAVGGWAATADCENLEADSNNYKSGNSSLKFDLSGVSTSGYLENSTLTSVNLSSTKQEGSIFLWVYLPTSSIITNFILRFGSAAGAYWSKTETTQTDGISFIDGWNLLRFNWSSATKTGSPDASAISYARITITYDGTASNDLRVDNMVYRYGELFSIDYYSKCLFRTSAGVWQESVDDDSNIVNLDTDSYNILLDKCAELASRQIAGTDSNFDYQTYIADYKEGVRRYQYQNKTEVNKPKNIYYRV